MEHRSARLSHVERLDIKAALQSSDDRTDSMYLFIPPCHNVFADHTKVLVLQEQRQQKVLRLVEVLR